MIDYANWGDKPLPVIDSDSEPYWEAARDGELAIQHCNKCGEYQFYPRRLCRHCWGRDLTFDTLEGAGSVYSFTECYVAGQPGYGEETPYTVALIELDLPSENPSGRAVRMISHVIDCSYEDLAPDMDVVIEFEDVGGEPQVYLPVFRSR